MVNQNNTALVYLKGLFGRIAASSHSPSIVGTLFLGCAIISKMVLSYNFPGSEPKLLLDFAIFPAFIGWALLYFILDFYLFEGAIIRYLSWKIIYPIFQNITRTLLGEEKWGKIEKRINVGD